MNIEAYTEQLKTAVVKLQKNKTMWLLDNILHEKQSPILPRIQDDKLTQRTMHNQMCK